MTYYKVKNNNKMLRDSHSKGIVVNDPKGLAQAKALKTKINMKEERIAELEVEMREVKALLKELLNGRD